MNGEQSDMAATNWISGISSGLDWRGTITQLKAVEHQRIDLISNKKTDYQNQLKAWQNVNTKLLALKTSADSLNREADFNLFTSTVTSSSTTDAEDLLAATSGTSAVAGTHSIEILQTARAQKVSSKSFTSQNTGLGASYAGIILVNGRSMNIAATDTLVDVRDRINDLNSGTNATNVTASIVSFSSSDYRLLLTSQSEGAEGMGIQQVGSANVLQSFGFITGTNSIKHTTSDGAKSDTFSSGGTAVSSLLDLSAAPTGNVTIGGQALAIDLSKTLTQIASDIDGLAGLSAEVVSSTVNGSTVYQIDISGTTSFVDNNNVLQTLGIIKSAHSSIQETHTSDTANTKTTAAGGGSITAATKWGEINTGGDSNNITNGDTITLTGTKHDGTAVSGAYSITDKNVDTVQGLLTQVDTLFGLDAGAAAIVDGKIRVTDSTSGDSALGIMLVANNQGDGDLNLGTMTASQQGYSMELQSGRDAQFKVDGNYMTRTSNTVTDAIGGVTLSLKKAEVGTAVTLNVSRGNDGLSNLIKDFVGKYNDVMTFIHNQSSYDNEKQQKGGVLFADGTLKSVKSDLMNNIVNKVWGVSSGFSIMGLVGINLDNQGQLTVDENKLKGYLQSNFEDVKRLFIANGTTTVGTLKYITHGVKTKTGNYTVNITRPTTQGSITGTTDLSGGLGGAENLTVTVGAASAGIALTGGMTLAQAVNAINTELDQSYAQVITGDKVQYADAGLTTKLSNSTTWNNVYDASGVSAGLVNGDTISFSGTDRSGTTTSGSYTISNVNTDTVQGLLSAIEVAYDNTAIASINSDGKITLTDKTTGTSTLALSVSNPVGKNLDFGTIDVDLTGSDGSHEGRYAIPVTASASADNKYLVLAHDNYGSTNSFSVSQTANQTGIVDGTYTGVDISGTINGEAAAGSGQKMTGSSGAANTDGLVVTYSGTSTGNVGNVNLTLGVAEGFYRSLYHINDVADGYVTFKQTSLQDNITRIETKIEDMEARLERRMNSLVNQFIAMEKAVGALQNQSAWLTSQINGLTGSS